MGAKLIELFEESKVGHQAVNAHLPKRRSLGMANGNDEAAISGSLYTNLMDHSQQLLVSQQYCVSNRPDPRVDPGHSSNSSPRKCQSLNKDAFSTLNSSTSSSELAMLKSKASKSVNRRNKLCRSLASHSRKAVTNRATCSQVRDDTAETENITAVNSDSDSDDNVRYSLVETNFHLTKDFNLKKTDSKVKIDDIAMKNKRLGGSTARKRRKPNDVKHKSLCVDPEIQLNLCISSVGTVHGSFKKDDQSSKLSSGATSLLCSNKQSLVINRIISDDGEVNKVSPNLPSSAAHKKSDTGSDASVEINLPFNESRRISIRQSELVYRFKEIVVRKWPGYVQLSLVTHTTAKNALNPKVFQELMDALRNAQFDDSRVVLLTGSGSVFCSGIDLHYLLTASDDRKTAAKQMAESLREFVHALSTFPKPVVAAVNGPAVGMGVAILALCDIVYASDKASFSCPYAKLCQTPEGCSSYTLPKIIGIAMANELLLCGRKITAVQACQAGLVSQVFWPTNMMQEVIPRVQSMASQSAKAMEDTKTLVQCRRRVRLEQINLTECQLLSDRWATVECQRAIQAYIDSACDVV